MESLLPTRLATPADAAVITALEAAGAAHPWSAASVAHALSTATGFGLLTEVDGVAVGHLLASAVGDEGELLTVAVHPDARRGGHGRALVDAALAAWASRGVTTVWLEVRVDNVAALTLYQRTGWEPAGTRRRYYADGTDAAVLRRALGPTSRSAG